MIINGSSNRCVWWWTQHLESEENDKVRIAKSYGLGSDNIHDMLEEMMDLAQGTKCQNPFYQINMNPGPGEHLTEQEWDQARQIAEKKHGLEGQPYFMVMHTKYGREHPHFIYSRIDLENMRAISDSKDARKNHAIAREIEREFGLQKVLGPYDREAGMPRPKRAPKKWEMYRDKQHGLDTRDIAAEVTELFQQSRNGPQFKAALEQHGYQLVTGRRGLLILDTAGNEHSLARRCGITMKELNAFMRDVDREALPTVEQGKAQYQERKIAGLEADRATVRHEIEWQEALARAAIEKEKIEGRFIAPEDREKETRAGRQEKEPAQRQQPENLKGVAAHIRNAREHSDSAKAFAAALDEHGIAFAVVTKEEAERSHREAEFAKAIGNYAPRYREGEIVAATEPRLEYRREGQILEPRRVHKLDQADAEKYLGFLKLDRSQLQGIDATKERLNARAADRAAYWQAIRLENATRINRAARTVGNIKAPAAALGKAAAPIGKVLEAVSNAVESLLAPTLTPEQKREGERATHEREAQADEKMEIAAHVAERAQERRQQEQDREAARQRQRDDRER